VIKICSPIKGVGDEKGAGERLNEKGSRKQSEDE
jgi:hypothetical protein